jgi:hypothetical protein
VSNGKPTTRKMSDAHEKFLEGVFGGNSKIMPNSGAGWAKQMDVRGSHTEEEFAFAVDGKSTFRESIGVTRDMWDKAVEQSANEIPALALRWYDTWRLDVGLDLVLVEAQTFKALLEAANENQALRKRITDLEVAACG